MKANAERVDAGQAVYTKRILSAYDLFVLGISNRYVWKCPTARIEAHYNQHVSSNHLDVGVGTGYFLDRCRFPSETPRIVLMDLNVNSLAFAWQRIARYNPETCQHNILEPICAEIGQFDSVGVSYLLHCLPGSVTEKAIVFEHLAPLMNSGAAIFGATILQGDVPRGWAAKQLMKLYNEKGIFSNAEDDLEGLESALKQRFENVVLDLVGCVALFSGRAR